MLYLRVPCRLDVNAILCLFKRWGCLMTRWSCMHNVWWSWWWEVHGRILWWMDKRMWWVVITSIISWCGNKSRLVRIGGIGRWHMPMVLWWHMGIVGWRHRAVANMWSRGVGRWWGWCMHIWWSICARWWNLSMGGWWNKWSSSSPTNSSCATTFACHL